MGKIGIFGGSFNPPHIGHILAAEELVRCLELDRLYLVPAAVPPHKKLAPNSPDAAARKHLVELALQGQEKIHLCDLELERGGTSYTAHTLQQLRQQHPTDELYLVMGSDMFLSLHDWYEPQQIMSLATIVLMRREAAGAQMQGALLRQKQKLEQQYGARVCFVENNFVDLSSTRVRRMLAFGCGEPFLPPAVYAQICEKQYYGVGEDLKRLPMAQLKEKVVSLLKPGRVAHVLGAAIRRWSLPGVGVLMRPMPPELGSSTILLRH